MYRPTSAFIVFIAFTVLGLLALTGCNILKQDPGDIDRGTLTSGRYTNEYFQFSIDVPADYVPVDPTTLRLVRKGDQPNGTGGTPTAGDRFAAETVNAIDLFVVSEFPLDDDDDIAVNPSIICVSERLAPGVKSSADFLNQTRRIMQQHQPSLSIDGVAPQAINGSEFTVMSTSRFTDDVLMRQAYYATIRQGFVVCFILSYETDDEADMLQSCVESFQATPAS